MADYQSSEELQRHARDAFIDKSANKPKADQSERDKLVKVLDRYIAQHSSTSSVRAECAKHSRKADYQLDLSADIVDMLEKIKSDLR